MAWSTPYVIFRISKEGKAEVVYVPEDLQKAKYWLQYIAEPGDVLCKTPLHAKHSKKSDTPEYWSHKEESGKPGYDEEGWAREAKRLGWDAVFPSI